MASVLCPRLVGREEEFDALREAIGALGERMGRTIVIAGEAGVGKSRLLREVAGEADRLGVPVLWGRAVEASSPSPFRPLAEALFSYLRRGGLPELPELEPLRPVLGRLVPERAPGSAAIGEGSLVVLGEAVLRLLRTVAGGTGCVLALEDLQWADLETVEVFEYLADNNPGEAVLCVATLRDEEPTDAAMRLRAMVARRAATAIGLRRFGPGDVEAMAAACLDAEVVPAPLLALLRSTAEGLPFLVEEVLSSGINSGDLRPEGAGWTVAVSDAPAVPASFSDTVRRRIRATPGVKAVLEAAAVLGRSFEWTLLAGITGLGEAAVTDLLRRAVETQLVLVEEHDGRAMFRFRHALTRQAILADLLPPERTALSARALAAVEAAHPGLPGERCALAADLAEQAGLVGRAAELLLEAARRALGQGALTTAAANLDRGRALAGTDRALGVDIDDTLCEVLALAGNIERLGEVGDRLLVGLSAISAPPTRVGAVHVRLARAAVVASDWDAASVHLDRARDLGLGTSDPEVDLLAAQLSLGRGQPERASSLAMLALAEAERLGRHDMACEAFEVIGRRERQRDLADAEGAFASALALAEAHGLALWRIRALHELGTIDLLSGGPVDRLAEARRAALGAGALATAATVGLQMGAWFLNHFELDQAHDFAGLCAAEARRLRMPVVEAFGLLFDAGAYGLRGRRIEMERAIKAAFVVAGDNVEIRGAAALQMRAGFWLVRDDRRRATAELDSGMDLLRDTSVTAPMRGMWALMRALEDRDGDAAATEVETSGLTVYWLIRGWVGHARAISLGRRGLPEEALEAFNAADVTLLPCEWYRQHARRLVAEAAVTDGWGDPRSWLGEALQFFDASGYEHVASACRSLLRRSGVPVPRRRRPAADAPPTLASLGLTARELEVLALLAEALPTREIAARLYLSPKTVERHIANIATKVGADGRAQLIAFAASRAPRAESP